MNNRNITPPYVINGIIIEKLSDYLIIYGYSGLTVLWDGQDSVYVHLDPDHVNITCGLCGNYNGQPADDLVTFNGQTTSSVAQFGNSWRMTKVGDYCPNVLEQATSPSCLVNLNAAIKKVSKKHLVLCHFDK